MHIFDTGRTMLPGRLSARVSCHKLRPRNCCILPPQENNFPGPARPDRNIFELGACARYLHYSVKHCYRLKWSLSIQVGIKVDYTV